MEEIRIQRPELSNNWLYEDWENNIRIFSKEVALGYRSSRWLECTNEEKEQWEKEYYVGNIPQPEPEPILRTLEVRKNELKAKFAKKQIEINQALITAEENVGSENPTLLYLKTQLHNERVRIITTIDNFVTIEEAMAFDIRDEDAQPFMDALYNLINSI